MSPRPPIGTASTRNNVPNNRPLEPRNQGTRGGSVAGSITGEGKLRKLVLVVREAPLSEIHLENMLKLARMGVVIFPPVPAFYNHPQSIEELVDHVVMRVLDQFGIHLNLMERWGSESAVPLAGDPE